LRRPKLSTGRRRRRRRKKRRRKRRREEEEEEEEKVMLDTGSEKGPGYPLHSPVSPSLPLPCVTVCHHISTGVYHLVLFMNLCISYTAYVFPMTNKQTNSPCLPTQH
jgi:hypothetical protein